MSVWLKRKDMLNCDEGCLFEMLLNSEINKSADAQQR